MAPTIRVLDPTTRTARRVRSRTVPSKLRPVPVDAKGRRTPRWDAADTNIRAVLDVPSLPSKIRFDLAIEATDDPSGGGPWYTVAAATSVAATATTRDGSVYRPSLSYQSTKMTAKHLRLSIRNSGRVRFSASIEVT